MPDTAAVAKTTPINVRKLGHLVYEVSDIERTTAFWTEILGFTVSDRNEFGMVFLRCAGDHHSIALVPSKKHARPAADAGLRFHHLAMEVDDMDVLFRARDFLQERGIPIDFEGPARTGRQRRRRVHGSRRLYVRDLRQDGSSRSRRPHPAGGTIQSRYDARRRARTTAARELVNR